VESPLKVAQKSLAWPRALLLTFFALLPLVLASAARGYSVLSHEEVVDMAWQGELLPLLQIRFPGLTDDQIKEAHAYAYGGSVIQDIGYYPFGDKQFSDLLHYVRTGDFVMALVRDASTPDELAFALGAMAHYYGDTLGHPVVNAVTAEEYPTLRRRFGRVVTYGEDPTAHLRTEFGFDVAEVAHGNYSQENYRDFIGFQVAKPLLERAFQETYGLAMSDVMKHEDLAIGTYRYSVSTLIPKMTHVALAGYHDQVVAAAPGFQKQKFIYRMRRTQFEKEYGKQFERPKAGAVILAFMLRFVPKIGPFRALQLKLPNADEQTQYLTSMNATVDAYRATLKGSLSSVAAPPVLPDLDFDTGNPTAEGEYMLADRTYADLAEELVAKKIAPPPDMVANIEAFYADPQAPDAVRAKPEDWAKAQAAVAALRQTQVSPAQPAAALAKPDAGLNPAKLVD
jgi:hypothetical protein